MNQWWKPYLTLLNVYEHPNKSFYEMTEFIVQIGNEEDLAKFFTIAWGLWSRRNKMIYVNINIHPEAVVEKALFIKLLYKECNEVYSNTKKKGGWTPPSNDFLKLNTDDTIFLINIKLG